MLFVLFIVCVVAAVTVVIVSGYDFMTTLSLMTTVALVYTSRQ